MQSEKGKEEVQQRLPKYRGLADLKAFVIAQINKRAYPGAVQTRAGTAVKGTLYKADESKLYFKLPYGEIPVPWQNIPPAQLATIFQWYINAAAADAQKEQLIASLRTFREELKVN